MMHVPLIVVICGLPCRTPSSHCFCRYFLIFFSVAGIGYFGGGYAYNTRQRGLSGTDAVPHYEFWVRLGNRFAPGSESRRLARSRATVLAKQPSSPLGRPSAIGALYNVYLIVVSLTPPLKISGANPGSCQRRSVLVTHATANQLNVALPGFL